MERTAIKFTLQILVGLLALAAHASQVTLAWEPNSETNIAGYVLYMGPQSGCYTNATDCGNVTNRTVGGLVRGATYYFVLTAYNTESFESDPSNEVKYTVPLTAFTNVITVALQEASALTNAPWTLVAGMSFSITNVRTNQRFFRAILDIKKL